MPVDLRLDNDRINAQEAEGYALVLESYPRTLALGLTTRCNLDCVMCAGRALKQWDMPDAILERLEPALERASTIAWSEAGEFFASPRVDRYIELIQKHRPRESRFSTNFIRIGPYLEAVLDSGITEMMVSIDAATKDTYESIRVGARWDQLLANFETFNRRKKERRQHGPSLSFVFVAMKSNIEELPEFVEFAKRQGATKVVLFALQPADEQGFPYEEEVLNREAERRYYLEALERGREIGVTIQDGLMNTWAILEDEDPKGESAPDRTSGPNEEPKPPLHRLLDKVASRTTACAAPWDGCVIQTNGKVRPSCCRPEILGDLRKSSFFEVWNGPAFQQFRKAMVIRSFSLCEGCPTADRLTLPESGARKEYFDLFRANAEKDLVHAPRKDLLGVVFEHGGGPAWRISRAAGRRLLRIGRGTEAAARLAEPLLRETARFSKTMESQLAGDNGIYLGALNEIARSKLGPICRERGISIDPVYSNPDSLVYRALFLSHTTPHEMRAGEVYEVELEILNASVINWPTGPDDPSVQPVMLSYHWRDTGNQMLVFNGISTVLPEQNGPFAVSKVRARVKAFDQPGECRLVWDLVRNGVAWFAEKGGTPLEVQVVITNQIAPS